MVFCSLTVFIILHDIVKKVKKIVFLILSKKNVNLFIHNIKSQFIHKNINLNFYLTLN